MSKYKVIPGKVIYRGANLPSQYLKNPKYNIIQQSGIYIVSTMPSQVFEKSATDSRNQKISNLANKYNIPVVDLIRQLYKDDSESIIEDYGQWTTNRNLPYNSYVRYDSGNKVGFINSIPSKPEYVGDRAYNFTVNSMIDSINKLQADGTKPSVALDKAQQELTNFTIEQKGLKKQQQEALTSKEYRKKLYREYLKAQNK